MYILRPFAGDFGQNLSGMKFVYKSEVRTMRREEAPMKIQYRFAKLSRDERELLEMVLLEEMDMQRWFTITYSAAFGKELFLSLN